MDFLEQIRTRRTAEMDMLRGLCEEMETLRIKNRELELRNERQLQRLQQQNLRVQNLQVENQDINEKNTRLQVHLQECLQQHAQQIQEKIQENKEKTEQITTLEEQVQVLQSEKQKCQERIQGIQDKVRQRYEHRISMLRLEFQEDMDHLKESSMLSVVVADGEEDGEDEDGEDEDDDDESSDDDFDDFDGDLDL